MKDYLLIAKAVYPSDRKILTEGNIYEITETLHKCYEIIDDRGNRSIKVKTKFNKIIDCKVIRALYGELKWNEVI